MKLKLFILLFLVFFSEGLCAQNKDTLKRAAASEAMEAPVPPGGTLAFNKALAESIVYPLQAKDAEASGIVYIRVLIDANGEADSFEIKKDIGYGCGQEAMRAIKALGKWKPATLNGKPVKARMVIPVRFMLDITKPAPFWVKWKKKRPDSTQ